MQEYPHKIFDILLGSETRARTLKFFFRHTGETFRIGEVARRILQNYNTTASYIADLEKVGILKKTSGSGTSSLYTVNTQFPNYTSLREFTLQVFPVSTTQTAQDIKETGRIRLALLEGIFLNQGGSSIDLFLVADDVDEKKLKEFIAQLEAQVGKELNYTSMDTAEFTYRYNIYDRFVRNIIKKPNIKLVDNLSLG
ncbi:MAG: hypothetical protein HY001_03600 [Candidatus Portnoybacteria bacterium]|nr:hypothetical protein [Candidatus Portnoybacteria bacterium]